MRGLTSIAAGVGLLALTFWVFSRDGSVSLVLMFGAGALFMFYHGLKGNGFTEAGDVTAPMDFIRNPAEAIVDAVTDKFLDVATEKLGGLRGDAGTEPGFDPDAAIARYMAGRPAPVAGVEGAAPTRPTFGRKGL